MKDKALTHKVEIYLKEPIRLKLGDTFDMVEIINQECSSLEEAELFAGQWTKEESAYKVYLFELNHWWVSEDQMEEESC